MSDNKTVDPLWPENPTLKNKGGPLLSLPSNWWFEVICCTSEYGDIRFLHFGPYNITEYDSTRGLGNVQGTWLENKFQKTILVLSLSYPPMRIASVILDHMQPRFSAHNYLGRKQLCWFCNTERRLESSLGKAASAPFLLAHNSAAETEWRAWK